MGNAAEVSKPTAAEDLAERTAKAVAYVMAKHAATDLATFTESLDLPDDDPPRMAARLEDGTEVFLRSLSYCASYSYGLCLLLLPDVVEAGKRFRCDDVQDELRASAMRVAASVMSK
jgi:hypothetical protein